MGLPLCLDDGQCIHQAAVSPLIWRSVESRACIVAYLPPALALARAATARPRPPTPIGVLFVCNTTAPIGQIAVRLFLSSLAVEDRSKHAPQKNGAASNECRMVSLHYFCR